MIPFGHKERRKEAERRRKRWMTENSRDERHKVPARQKEMRDREEGSNARFWVPT